MKIAINAGLLARLGVTAAAVLLSQQALAVGTDAGVTVVNRASVDYSVNGEDQEDIESSPNGNTTPGAGLGEDTTFVVDRRVNFTVSQDDDIPVVQPATTGHVMVFTITNLSNSELDFEITLNTAANGSITIDGQTASGAALNPVAPDILYVENLAEDDTVDITVTGDAPGTLVDGDVAIHLLQVDARDPAGDSATPVALVDGEGSADDPDAIDNVFMDTDNDAQEIAADGVAIASASLEITKAVSVYSDPFNGVSADAKAIPDAILEYTITIDNTSGSLAADNIVVTDVILDDTVLYEADSYGGGGDATIDAVECDADDNNPANDGCGFDGTDTFTFQIATIAAGGSSTITYRVRVNPADPTP